jgi:LCP family protein required for cell wall assembly
MKKNMILWGLLVFIILSSIGAGMLYKGYLDTLDDMTLPDNITEEIDEDKKAQKADHEPFIMLMYGIDERPLLKDPGRPDTMMLALIDPELLKVKLISIPRDSYVNIPGRMKKDKINHSYSIGGPELTIQTIEDWLNIEIYGSVAIDFDGFRELVDLAGGVDVYVDQTIRYDSTADGTHIRLTKGQQVLDGKNALDFVRARLDNRGPRYYTSDYQRMERQQLVLKELGKQIISLQSLPKIFDIMKAVGGNVSTTLSAKELDQMIRRFSSFSMSNLETTSIQGNALRLSGVWYEEVDEQEITRIQGLISDFMERTPKQAKEENNETETKAETKIETKTETKARN